MTGELGLGESGLVLPGKDCSPENPLLSKLERVMRFELTTLCLGSKYSTTELHPQVEFNYRQRGKGLSISPFRSTIGFGIIVKERRGGMC